MNIIVHTRTSGRIPHLLVLVPGNSILLLERSQALKKKKKKGDFLFRLLQFIHAGLHRLHLINLIHSVPSHEASNDCPKHVKGRALSYPKKTTDKLQLVNRLLTQLVKRWLDVLGAIE